MEETKCTRKVPLICVVGKSGAGKTTTIRDSGLKEVVSYATREMREGESQGDPYHFIHEVDFKLLEERGALAESRPVYGHYKGVSWEELNTKQVFAITPDGVEDLKKLGVPVFVVYVSGEPFKANRENFEEYDFSNVEFDLEIPNSKPRDERSWTLACWYTNLCNKYLS